MNAVTTVTAPITLERSDIRASRAGFFADLASVAGRARKK